MTEQKKPGVEMRRQVMGDVFVDRALAISTCQLASPSANRLAANT